MTDRVPLLRGGSVNHDWIDNEDGTYTVLSTADAEPDLEYSKALANEDAGWNADKTFRRAAHIPDIIWLKWLQEEGWDAYDPANFDKLKRKLNSSDFMYLRTAHWRI